MKTDRRKQKDYEILQVVLFDGECAMCSGLVRFSLSLLEHPQTAFVASQSDAGRELLSRVRFVFDSSTVYLLRSGEHFQQSDALIALCQHFRLPYRYLSALRFVPKRLRDGIYRWVANMRHRIPVSSRMCRIDPTLQHLFLDSEDVNWPDWLTDLKR